MIYIYIYKGVWDKESKAKSCIKCNFKLLSVDFVNRSRFCKKKDMRSTGRHVSGRPDHEQKEKKEFQRVTFRASNRLAPRPIQTHFFPIT